MSGLPSFQQAQFKLANIIRTGEGRIDGVEQRRLKIYQELFFNNVEGFCSTAFPVFKSLLGEAQWKALISEFFIKHECETPHFVEISQEFLAYVAENKQEALPYPYMVELAHYEWVELASSVAADDEMVTGEINSAEAIEDLMSCPFAVSESTYPLSYQYPVHTISEDNKEEVELEPTNLLVYRDADYDVQFVLTDQISVIALQLLDQLPEPTGNAVVEVLSTQNPNLTAEALTPHLSKALLHFAEIGAITVKN